MDLSPLASEDSENPRYIYSNITSNFIIISHVNFKSSGWSIGRMIFLIIMPHMIDMTKEI